MVSGLGDGRSRLAGQGPVVLGYEMLQDQLQLRRVAVITTCARHVDIVADHRLNELATACRLDEIAAQLGGDDVRRVDILGNCGNLFWGEIAQSDAVVDRQHGWSSRHMRKTDLLAPEMERSEAISHLDLPRFSN